MMQHIGQPPIKKTDRQVRTPSKAAKTPVEEKEEAIARDPAVERGERIHTGKTIARGGQDRGHVPGATESPPGPEVTEAGGLRKKH